MIGTRLAARGLGAKASFRWRGTESMRIEGFSDGVFAFAVTLLVVSLEVPRTFAELYEAIKDFPAFACAFALLVLVWYNQYRFFRRYGLQDAWSIFLNAALLFVVLFFVYPLKFLFTLLIRSLFGRSVGVPLPDGTVVAPLRPEDWVPLMVIYGLGFMAIYAIFFLLHLHALRKADQLELTPVELFDTWAAIRENIINLCIGGISIFIVVVMGHPGLGGLTYCLIGPALTLHGRWSGSRRRALSVGAA